MLQHQYTVCITHIYRDIVHIMIRSFNQSHWHALHIASFFHGCISSFVTTVTLRDVHTLWLTYQRKNSICFEFFDLELIFLKLFFKLEIEFGSIWKLSEFFHRRFVRKASFFTHIQKKMFWQIWECVNQLKYRQFDINWMKKVHVFGIKINQNAYI